MRPQFIAQTGPTNLRARDRQKGRSNLKYGYLLNCDISGCTMYLTESELDHAKDTLAALLDLSVEHTRPPLIISRQEGDAVISYDLQKGFFRGQTLLEVIENTYVAFRKAIERMVLNNTCQCNACANVSQLDLKFFTHFGEFAVQHTGGHDELVASDVNLVHRLLKNDVQAQTGCRAYSLSTNAAIRELGLEEMTTAMIRNTQSYEHLGDIQVWVQHMHPVWEQKRAACFVTLPPERLSGQLEIEIDLPPERVWEYLSQPEFRSTLFGSDRQEVLQSSNGRIGAAGSVYHCYHGDKSVPRTILEWQPFQRIVTREVLPVRIENTLVFGEYRLLPTGGGTRLRLSYTKPEGPSLGRLLLRIMSLMLYTILRNSFSNFKERIEEASGVEDGIGQAEDEISRGIIRQAAAGLEPSKPASPD